jgi:hypothetical protein
MLDSPTDGGLHNIHFLGCASEVQLLGSGDEIPD